MKNDKDLNYSANMAKKDYEEAKYDTEEIYKILKQIKSSARSGKSCFWTYGSLQKNTEEYLKELGYIIKKTWVNRETSSRIEISGWD